MKKIIFFLLIVISFVVGFGLSSLIGARQAVIQNVYSNVSRASAQIAIASLNPETMKTQAEKVAFIDFETAVVELNSVQGTDWSTSELINQCEMTNVKGDCSEIETYVATEGRRMFSKRP